MARISLSVLDDRVLDSVMKLFWQRGFFNLSVEDIVAETGLHRAALYKHFQDKEGLFLAMLKRYEKNITQQFMAPLQTHHSDGLKAIKVFFTQFLTLHKFSEISPGCFLIATASDIPFHQSDVKTMIHQFYARLHQLFSKILKQQLPKKSHLSANALADFLVANVVGIMTLLRSQAPQKMMRNQVNSILQFISTLTMR